MLYTRTTLLLLGSLVVAVALRAQPGTLDPTFVPSGASFDGNVRNIIVQPDGKVLIGGYFTSYNGVARSGIARLEADGTLDASFATVGSGFNGFVNSIALQPDGKVIAGGTFTSYNGVSCNRVARLESNGTLDNGFHAWTGFSGVVQALALQTDGQLLVGGSLTTFLSLHDGMFRLHDDGTLDPLFGALSGFVGAVQALTIQANGSVLAAGTFTSYAGISCPGLARLSILGILDLSFLFGSGFNGQVTSLTPMPGGKTMATGFFTSYDGTPCNRIAVLNSNGNIDTGFSAANSFNSQTYAVTIAPDGKLLVGGAYTQFGGTPRSRIARLNADGTLDSTFDPSTGCDNSVFALALDPTGNSVYIGGALLNYSGTPRTRVARLSNCTPVTWYADADGDGLGDNGSTTSACATPLGYVGNHDDCDDNDDAVGAGTVWYIDADGDESGDPFNFVIACQQPPGTSEDPADCDDTDPLIVPSEECEDNDPYTTGDILRPYPECGCRGKQLVISAKVFLQGPYDPNTGLMRDDLRVAGLIPLVEPYTALGYVPAGDVATGSTTTPAVLVVEGPNAIVDWVILEMRSSISSTTYRSTRYALLQRDGDIVEPDGISPVRFPLAPTNYRIAVTHRNHMGVVEYQTGEFNGSYYETTTRDLTSPSFEVYGTDARINVNGVMLLRAGDVSFNDDIQYVGFGNDRDPILTRIGGSLPTNTFPGYYTEDVNMDGVVKYVGQGNDRDAILLTIGGSVPTNIRWHVYDHPTN